MILLEWFILDFFTSMIDNQNEFIQLSYQILEYNKFLGGLFVVIPYILANIIVIAAYIYSVKILCNEK